MAAKTVTLFLMDGSPSGRIKCTLANWIGQVFLIPRTDLRVSTDRVELKQTGVYILVGIDDETGEERAYIGQARERKNGTGVLKRISEHVCDGESSDESGTNPAEAGHSTAPALEEKSFYFTHAIAIIASDDSFGPTEISYLESAFYEQAQQVGRVVLTNKNTPSPGKVTEEKKAELDEFIDFAKIAIRSVGYRLLDPVDDARVPLGSKKLDSKTAEPFLKLDSGDCSGCGRQTDDGFVVLAGAKLHPTVVPSAPKSVAVAREKFAERINGNELTKDTLFSSPSAAAGFLTGWSINGKTAWKDGNGKTLSKLEKEEIELTNQEL